MPPINPAQWITIVGRIFTNICLHAFKSVKSTSDSLCRYTSNCLFDNLYLSKNNIKSLSYNPYPENSQSITLIPSLVINILSSDGSFWFRENLFLFLNKASYLLIVLIALSKKRLISLERSLLTWFWPFSNLLILWITQKLVKMKN